MFKILLPAIWLLGLALLIAGCSSSQQTATSPSSTNAVSNDSQVNAILEQSCYQCHSTGGTAPWYAAVSPTYLAANSARGALNFSDWQAYDAQKKADALKTIEDSVSAGSMPPGDYTALDHSARLADDQKQALLKWASQPALPAQNEVLSMARAVINVIRSCAFAYLLTIAVLVHGAASAELRSGTLELDPSKTLIEFRLPGSLHTTHGTFKLERGTIIADPVTGKAGGSIVVDARSGDTGIGARDNEMRESVLEAERYPEITFDPQHFTLELESGGQFQATMQGVLSLHGGRHDVALTAQGQLVGDNLTATAHFSVPYVEWGMQDPSVLFLTVAKQVDIDLATSGAVVWKAPAGF